MNLKVKLLEPIDYDKLYVSQEELYNVYKVAKAYIDKKSYPVPSYINIDFLYQTGNLDELNNTESCYIIKGSEIEYIKHHLKILNVEGERIFPLIKKQYVMAYYKVLNDKNSREFLNLHNKFPFKFRPVFLKPTDIDNSTKEVFGDFFNEL